MVSIQVDGHPNEKDYCASDEGWWKYLFFSKVDNIKYIVGLDESIVQCECESAGYNGQWSVSALFNLKGENEWAVEVVESEHANE